MQKRQKSIVQNKYDPFGVFFLFKIHSPKLSTSDMVTEHIFICLFVSVLILFCYCHFLTMMSWKRNFFLKSFVSLSQNVQQPKATRYTYITCIWDVHLSVSILISIYLFPYFYLICSCFFIGRGASGVIEEHTSVPALLLLYPGMHLKR